MPGNRVSPVKYDELESQSPVEILAWAIDTFGEGLGISTAFGVEGCAIVDMAYRIDPRIRVFTVDTGYLFPESLALIERFRERYPGLRLEVFQAEKTVAEQDQLYGIRLHDREPDRCCAMRKVEPTDRALEGLQAWVAGLRRDQGSTRAGIRVAEVYDHRGQPLTKIHPLASWTRDDTWRYVLANDVPYNPLLDQGYKSIGCQPCTRPVKEGESERDGRWSGQEKKECGIHTFLPTRRGASGL